jgi:Mrp family chromosome partitioning ATPase
MIIPAAANRPPVVPFAAVFDVLRSVADPVWANLIPPARSMRPFSIGVVSPRRRDGATTVAACASLGLARAFDEPVLHIEANVYSPGLGRFLSATNVPGLSAVARGKLSLEGAWYETELPRLRVMLAGDGDRPDIDQVRATLDSILDTSNPWGRFVVVDMPPLLDHPEAALLLARMDRIVAVVRAGETRRGDVQHLIESLGPAGDRFAGCVLNRYESDLPRWLSALERR